MVLLVLRHTLPIIISGAGDYPITLFTVRIANTLEHFSEIITMPVQQFGFSGSLYVLHFAVANVENHGDSFACLHHG